MEQSVVEPVENTVLCPCSIEAAGLADLLSELGYPEEQRASKTEAILGEYRAQPDRLLLALTTGNRLDGLIGLHLLGSGRAVIRHLVVTGGMRRKGLGRRLVEGARRQLALNYLTAETDGAAVGFYRRLGFAVRSLGEKYPGVERFECTWQGSGEGACS